MIAHNQAPVSPWQRVRAELSHHAVLIGLTLTYCAIALSILYSHGLGGVPVFRDYLVATLVPLTALAAFRIFGEIAYHIVHVRPFAWRGLLTGLRRSEVFSFERAAAALVPVLLVPLFASVFTTFKVSIPEMEPFTWDPQLMRLDQTLHGGMHPWEILQPLFGHPFVSSAISYLYNIWQGLILIVYWQMFRIQDRELRMRFLIAFVLAWAVLGSGGALTFSSAGPCFYGAVVDGPNPYADLMAYLNAAHAQYQNWGIIAQNYLWRIYQDGNAHLGGGISAMPSLHLGVGVLVFLLARAYKSRLAWLAGAYVMILMIGSVHLAWHYAVDGYFGIAGGWLAWIAAGWLTNHLVAPPPPTSADNHAP